MRTRKETCSYHRCKSKATHLARHGVYRGLPLCAKHHEGPPPVRTKRKAAVPDFTFKEMGLLRAFACSSLPKRATLQRAKAQPCGTRLGWVLVPARELPENVPSNPWPCNDHPTHKHYLFTC